LALILFGLLAASPRQMSLSLSKTELAYIQGSREFTKEQANREAMKRLRQEEKAKKFGDDPEDLVCR
jgi:hypothetical protein